MWLEGRFWYTVIKALVLLRKAVTYDDESIVGIHKLWDKVTFCSVFEKDGFTGKIDFSKVGVMRNKGVLRGIV